MDELDLNLDRLLPIWWAFLWRFLVGSFICGFVMGLLVGIVMGIQGHPELAANQARSFGWLLALPASIWAVRGAIGKAKYGGFRIALVPDSRI